MGAEWSSSGVGRALHSRGAQHQGWSPPKVRKALKSSRAGREVQARARRQHLGGEGTVAGLGGCLPPGGLIKCISMLRIRRVRLLPVREGSYKAGMNVGLELREFMGTLSLDAIDREPGESVRSESPAGVPGAASSPGSPDIFSPPRATRTGSLAKRLAQLWVGDSVGARSVFLCQKTRKCSKIEGHVSEDAGNGSGELPWAKSETI